MAQGESPGAAEVGSSDAHIPLRFWAELKSRIQALDANPGDVDKLAELAELGWVVKGPPLTWHFLKWDPVA